MTNLDAMLAAGQDGMSKGIPPMFPHQQFSRDFYVQAFLQKDPHDRGTINLSKCGTGKTRGVIEFIKELRRHGLNNKLLVLAPLTILEPSWADDIQAFTPELTFSICYAKGRAESFKKDADVYLLNHDAVTYLAKNQQVLRSFGANPILCIDEVTAYKNASSIRATNTLWLRQFFYYVITMSGTLGSQLLLDYHQPMFITDGGKRLGNLYEKFKSEHMKEEVIKDKYGRPTKGKRYSEIEGARAKVYEAIKDIAIRFDEDMAPLNTKRHVYVDLPAKAQRAYKDMVSQDFMVGEDGSPVTAANAAVKLSKLLQLCSGNVYDENGQVVSFHSERIELACDLAMEAEQAIIAFNFTHERDAVFKTLLAKGVPIDEVAYIDGSVPLNQRTSIVRDFQAGVIKYAILHPRSCAHGLTFTAGRRTIWVSPPMSSESFIQLNHRIDRAGQKHETETITICSKGTKEAAFYRLLFARLDNLYEMLGLFAEDTRKKVRKELQA